MMMGDFGKDVAEAVIGMMIVCLVVGGVVSLGVYWLFNHLTISIGWR
jgi:hypothetical protein